jgi:predicted RND superfamily exporter protein
MGAFYAFLLKHPKLVLAVFILITAAFAVPASRIRIDSSVEGLMLETDPDRVFFDHMREIFGNDEVLVIALVAQDTIFRPGSLRKIQRISDEMKDMDGVERVISLTTVYDILPTEEGLEIQPLVDEIPEQDQELEALRAAALKNDLFRNAIVSKDGRSAAVNIFVENRPGEEAFREEIIKKALETVAREQGPEAIHIAGVPYSKWAMNKYMLRDLTRFTPLTVLLVSLTLLVSFASIRGVLVPLVTVGAATIWTLGVMALLGKSISVVSTVIPSLVMAIGSAYAIHVVSHYYSAVRQGRSDLTGLRESFTSISLPVAIAALTTIAGFVSITVNRVSAVRDFGVAGMFGILFCFILSLTLAPALLSMLKARPPGKWGMDDRDGTNRWLETLASFNVRHRRAIISVSVILLVWGLIGIRYLKVETAYMSYLKEEDPVIRDLNEIEQEFAGTVLWNVVVEGKEEDILKDPEIVRNIDQFQEYLNDQPWIDKTTSYLDYLKWIHRALTAGEQRAEGLPTTREEISQCLLLYSFSDPDTLDQLVNPDFSKANIMVRAKDLSSSEMKENLRGIEEEARMLLPDTLTAKMTGTGVLMLKTADQIAVGQAESLSIAVVVIFFIMWLMFLSLKVSLVSMIPNIIPIGILFGIMGWMGITLNTTTSLIASVTLAIAVDDTIHYLTRFNRELKKTYNEQDAMKSALLATGRPICYTTVALCLGFLILCLSNFLPIIYFGSLTALTFAICLLADIIFLPAVLLTTKIVTVWDLFLLKMGKDPEKTIPLFGGMRPSHARLLVLMGMLRSYEKAKTIIRKGERGNEMYLVLKGEVEIYDDHEGVERTLAVCSRGDVFGEMGLIRGTSRSASARAREDADLFVFNNETLTKMQRNYPRISSRFFLNLSKILSDRLQKRTDKYLESLV